LHENDVAKFMLCVVGDSDGGGVSAYGNPFVFFGVATVGWIRHFVFSQLIYCRLVPSILAQVKTNSSVRPLRRKGLWPDRVVPQALPSWFAAQFPRPFCHQRLAFPPWFLE